MVESSPTRTKTKLRKTTKATTIAAMVVIATIIAAPMITNKLAYAAPTTANTNAGTISRDSPALALSPYVKFNMALKSKVQKVVPEPTLKIPRFL